MSELLRAGVPETAVRHAMGNAMSLNVVFRLLPRVAYAAGLLAEPVKDPWKHLTKQDAKRDDAIFPDFVYQATCRRPAAPAVIGASAPRKTSSDWGHP